MKKLLKNNEVMLLSFLAVLIVIFSIMGKNFLAVGNIMLILSQMSELAFITIGISASILSGGFDLSIGALTGLGTVLLALMMKSGTNMWLAMLLTLCLMLVGGLINGILIGRLRITAMLATLGTQSLFTGIALVLSLGQAISGLPTGFMWFGQDTLGMVPVQVFILAIVMIPSYLLLNKTPWGRNVYLVGTNETAAKFNGINTNRVLIKTYLFSATMSFFAALILTSRLATGRSDLGDPYQLQALSAAVFGGISIKGGSGNIIGALIGVAIFSVISNGLNNLDVSQFVQQVVMGSILIVTVAVRIWNQKKTSSNKIKVHTN